MPSSIKEITPYESTCFPSLLVGCLLYCTTAILVYLPTLLCEPVKSRGAATRKVVLPAGALDPASYGTEWIRWVVVILTNTWTAARSIAPRGTPFLRGAACRRDDGRRTDTGSLFVASLVAAAVVVRLGKRSRRKREQLVRCRCARRDLWSKWWRARSMIEVVTDALPICHQPVPRLFQPGKRSFSENSDMEKGTH